MIGYFGAGGPGLIVDDVSIFRLRLSVSEMLSHSESEAVLLVTMGLCQRCSAVNTMFIMFIMFIMLISTVQWHAAVWR